MDIAKEDRPIIKVLGVGGGGSNAVEHMFTKGIKGVEFAISNTDIQAMEASSIPTKLQLGPVKTEGRGAGSKPQVGKEACIESIDSVREFLSDNTKMVFITAGMGGGTGTGAAPIIAKAAKDLGILTIAIVTLPFNFEGSRRIRQAYEGLEELKKNVDSILVISNDKLRMIHGDLPLSEAFGYADDILSTAAKGIAEIITVAGYINVDFEDVNTVMKDSGITIMGSAISEGDGRAQKAVEKALASPLLEDSDIRGAKHILLNITSGTKEVTMDEIGVITEYIQGEAGYNTDLIWGNCKNDDLGENISVTIIATGFEESTNVRAKPKKEKNIVELDDNIRKKDTEGAFELEVGNDDSFNIVDFKIDDVKDTIDEFDKNAQEESAYDREARKARLEKLRRMGRNTKHFGGAKKDDKYSLDTPDMIYNYESVPAYKRKRVLLDDEFEKYDPNDSNYKVGIDENEPISKRNSFLHDNVD